MSSWFYYKNLDDARSVGREVSKLDLLVAISSTILNGKGAIVSPCLNPLFTLNTEDTCLPILA